MLTLTIYGTVDVDDGVDHDDERKCSGLKPPRNHYCPMSLTKEKKLLFVCSVEFVYYYFSLCDFVLHNSRLFPSLPYFFSLLSPISRSFLWPLSFKTYYECLCHLLYPASYFFFGFRSFSFCLLIYSPGFLVFFHSLWRIKSPLFFHGL